MSSDSILAIAQRAVGAGVSVVPARVDHIGSRLLIDDHAPLTSRLPSEDELASWFGTESGANAIGVVCGRVSGGAGSEGLEGIEFEEGASAWLSSVRRLSVCPDGPLVVSGGGYSQIALYRVRGDAVVSKDPARRPTTARFVGEGDVAICVPGPMGSGDIAQVRAYDRRCAWSFRHVCQLVCREDEQVPFGHTRPQDCGYGDPRLDYNAHASIPHLLEEHGWRRAHVCTLEVWERSGTAGVETLGVHNRMISPIQFDTHGGRTTFELYADLQHGGDLVAAARAAEKALGQRARWVEKHRGW